MRMLWGRRRRAIPREVKNFFITLVNRALNVERSNLEDIDPADAILELVWAQTCYNAALQVGTNVIPQSLMDYMK